MDRLEAMAVLMAVVETGTLSDAARRLGAPLATVSRKVLALEEHLGARLLIRTSRRVMLTDAGRAYVDASRRILDDVEEAEKAAAGEYAEPRGDLTITAPVVLGRRHVLPVIGEFLTVYPRIDVRLLLADRQLNLLDDHVDLAIRIGHLEDSSLTCASVGQVRQVICASPQYLARRGVPMTPAELEHHDGVSFRTFSDQPAWRYRGIKDGLEIEPRPRLAVNSVEAAIDAAIAGVGLVRVLSYQVADEIRAGKLVMVLDAQGLGSIPVQMVYPAQGRLLAKSRAFFDWAAPRLRSRLSEFKA